MLNVIDLFCGTGALSYGIERSKHDFRLVSGIDMDGLACSTAQLNHDESKIICADITRISPKRFADKAKLTQVDVVVGGPPCQGFSSLRPNRSTNTTDPRNRLYAEFAHYVAYFQPKAFLMENVVGLLSHGNGRLLASILTRFKQIGYRTDWRVLNCAHFGIPQKRERFILLGVRDEGKNTPDIVFPMPTHHFAGKVIGTRLKDNYIANDSAGARALSVMDAISDLPSVTAGGEAFEYLCAPRNAYQRARRSGAGSALTLHNATAHSAAMLNIIKHAGSSRSALPRGLVSSGFSSTYSRLDPTEPATTITVKFTSPASSKCIHPAQHRAITPREAARLQSFDDNFQFAGGRTQIAEQIGNAVPPVLGTVLADSLIRLF